MPKKYLLITTAVATSLLWFGCANAQSSAPTSDGQSASASPSRPEAGEIIVTANKREQNLSQVGLTISAVSGADLANQRISNVSDLAKATPGLAFAPTPNATPVYTLRGIGFFETTLAAYPDVSVYIDQVPLSLPVLTTLTAFDLERVEVLKGPQGTLFGNNATGGAINFVARKPTSEFEAGAEISYGRFNTIETSGYVSGPIADSLRARLAIKGVNGDEWQRSYTRNDKLGKQDNIAGRLLVDWDASDRLKFSLNVNAWRDQNDPQAPQYTQSRPQNPTVAMGGIVPNDYPVVIYPAAPDNARAADWSTEHRPYADHKFWQTALRADWELADDIILTSITGYSHMRFLNATSGGGANLNLQDLDRALGRIKSFTQELRISNGANNPLRYTVGANYERTNVFETIDLYMSGTTAALVYGFNGNQYGSTQKMKNYAVFGNLEYDVNDRLTLKGGIRQTKAKRSAVEEGSYEIPGYFEGGAFGENSLTAFFNLAYEQIYGFDSNGDRVVPLIAPGNSVTLDTRVNPDGSPVDPNTYLKAGRPSGSLNENSTSWSLGVNYKPVDSLLLYFNVAKGYKAGSFPTLAGAIYDAFAPVKQEALLDFEGGFKAQAFDKKLSINGAAFYYDYKNKQTRAKFIDPIFGSLDKLLNIPKSRVFGAEVEINGRPLPGLSLSGAVTYLDAKVRKYDAVVGFHIDPDNGLRIADTASARGVPLPFAPKWQFALRADYTVALNDALNVYFGAGWNGQTKTVGSIYVTDEDKDAFKIKGYTLVNLNAGIGSADERWKLSVWGKNIFNKFYWSNAIQAYDNLIRYTGRPAEYGVTIATKF